MIVVNIIIESIISDILLLSNIILIVRANQVAFGFINFSIMLLCLQLACCLWVFLFSWLFCMAGLATNDDTSGSNSIANSTGAAGSINTALLSKSKYLYR